MAIPQLIRTTDTSRFGPLAVGGVPAVHAAPELRDLMETRLGPGSASFFAEPAVAGRPGQTVERVSWFGEHAGEGVALGALTGAAKAQAEEHLRQTMRRLAPLMADARHAPLLRAALMVPSDDDVRIVGGDPVLTNWGFVPPGVDPNDSAQLDRHWTSTLGRFAPFPSPWRAAASVLPPDPAPTQAPAAVPPPAAAVAPPPPAAAVVAAPLLPWYQRPAAWAGCAAAILVAGVAIGLLLRFLLPPQQIASSDRIRALIQAQVEVNRGLAEQEARLRELLAGDVCTVDDPLGSANPKRPVFPVEGDPAKPAEKKSEGDPAKETDTAGDRLIDVIDSGTVLVITEASKGTGFFVAPGFVATNRHVVEPAKDGKAYVISKALGRVVPASIVAVTPENPEILRDYALLKLPDGAAEKAQVLRVTSTLDRLDQVVAAGFPGFVIQHDAHFQALMKGDLTSVPDAVVSNGIVSTIQAQPEGAGAIIHTAILSHGNSGGPLLDLCGRVVGINTLIALDKKSHRQSNISLTTADLVAFLKANNVPVTTSDGRCKAPKVG
jgi:S1-C subfamily serine protease